ncbi:MAG: bifunctional [glutamine synthetase] adenylyltransferase/[glutamine synthetase]-adenylyl-L-tyrosine phosphorylase [Magnetovibrionaceae bacterium]
MTRFRFAAVSNLVPAPWSENQAKVGLDDWTEKASEHKDSGAKAAVLAPGEDGARALLTCLAGNSPYLGRLAIREQDFMTTLMEDGPDQGLHQVYGEFLAPVGPAESEAELARRLRIAKRRAALAIAVGDITSHFDLARVTQALSDLADRTVALAAGFLLKALHEKGALTLPEPETAPERGSGLVVLGMGKLGARELNYSSDIDLIILFDPDRIETDNPGNLQTHFTRLARGMAKLLGERTVDGYVWRTDLRLRPDPGSTPPALSVLAAETYYESTGQNWERAAMIKARAIAGDGQAAAEFLGRLRPFVWRKSLDFHAIRDVQSIKRQIHAHKGGGTVRLDGHNIKLGRGGIREIEFFAQTQQLIWGGRDISLRRPGTEAALSALVDAGHLAAAVRDDLIADYRFLRWVEHRLQMINDEQTQTLPDDKEGLAHLACFLGYRALEDFSLDMLACLHRVEAHYGNLFEDEPDLGANLEGAGGNLAFTGTDSDPDTLKNLEAMGFEDSARVDAIVRGWHHGRYRATTSQRARQLLTELMPAVLSALAETPQPDDALIRFDAFLKALPAGVQLFSMFQTNPQLLALLAEIMGGAPRLAVHLSHRPAILDGVLAPDFMNPSPDLASKQADLSHLLSQATATEEALDLTRRWSHDRRFQIGVKRLRDWINVDEAGIALSDIAEASLNGLVPFVARDFEAKHGSFEASGLAVVAYGKMGSREMTHESDLDLVFIYGVPENAEFSDGEKPLPPTVYFQRLSQRLIGAVTAPTAEGELYELDMRLRPSGQKGPIASRLESFVQYQRDEAWTWEHMALTRARLIAGPRGLQDHVAREIRAVLTAKRDPDKLLADVAHMRSRVRDEKGTSSLWRIKTLNGGMMDLDFIAQYLQLRHASAHPGVLATDSATAFARLAEARLIEADCAERLIAAQRLWRDLQGLIRLALPSTPIESDEDLPQSLKARLAKAAGVVDYLDLKDKITGTAADVQRTLDALILEPAAKLPKPDCPATTRVLRKPITM